MDEDRKKQIKKYFKEGYTLKDGEVVEFDMQAVGRKDVKIWREEKNGKKQIEKFDKMMADAFHLDVEAVENLSHLDSHALGEMLIGFITDPLAYATV